MENNETFFARITPRFIPSEERKIRLAYVLAKAGHRNQFRKETDNEGNQVRYFEHPRRVALILLDELCIYNHKMICAAFLHDGLEDIRGLTPEMIEDYFGEDVCRWVKKMTKTASNKNSYYQELVKSPVWEVLVVKCCDRLDNLRTLEHGTRKFQEKQIKETKEEFPYLFQAMKDAAKDDAQLFTTHELVTKIRLVLTMCEENLKGLDDAK